jgi:Flp pilus assembly protein TadD
VAREEGALLVDADRIFTEASEHGLVGFNLIEDYVHPTVEGHQLIAWHLWQAIENAGWLPERAPVRRELFERVVAERGSPVNERNFAWLYNQGVVLENQGRDALAVEKYREALALDPRHWGAMGNLARLLGQQGQLEEARALAEQMVQANPDHPRYLSLLGVILTRLGDLPEAETRLRQALAGREEDALAHHNLGRVLEQRGRADEAAEHYDRARLELYRNNRPYVD